MTVVESINGKSGKVELKAPEVEAIPASEAGKANGVATLDSGGKLTAEQLPSSVVTGSHHAEDAAGNMAIGCAFTALVVGAKQNTALGFDALTDLTEGSENVAIGTSTLEANTTGKKNTAVGKEALSLNTTGSSNVAIGISALAENTTGGKNMVLGARAMLHRDRKCRAW